MIINDIFQIEYLENDIYPGGFLAGDFITIHYDSSLSGLTTSSDNLIVIRGNYTTNPSGTQVFDAPDIIPEGNQTVGFSAGVKIDPSNPVGIVACFGNDRLGGNFISTFPYIRLYLLENEASCSVNVCNLSFVSPAQVTNSSDEGVSDGIISIAATTTAPGDIHFNIGSDFLYGDGTSISASGVPLDFAGLLPGSYRIFARDSNNCAANIIVAVGVDNAYGPIKRLEYTDRLGYDTRIDITKRNYSGAIAEVCGSDSPFNISKRLEGESNKFPHIASVSCDIGLIAEENEEFIDLYTLDPLEFRVEYKKDFGSGFETLWNGKLLPAQYQEAYLAPPNTVSLTATDGTAELGTISFAKDDGLPLSGKMSQIKLLAFCLRKTGFRLDIRVACNLYALDMDQTDSDDPLDQAYVDVDRYYLNDDNPSIDSIIRQILTPYGATLMQWGNRWNIRRTEELVTDYDWRQFDYNGDYVSNGTSNSVVDIKFPSQDNNDSILFAEKAQNLEIVPGYGKIRMIYDLGLKRNMLFNGDFRYKSIFNPSLGGYDLGLDMSGFQIIATDYTISTDRDEIDENNVALVISGADGETTGEAYILSDAVPIKMNNSNGLKVTVSFKLPVTYSSTDIYTLSIPYQKVRLQVILTDGPSTYYMTTSGAWTVVPRTMQFYVTEFNKYTDIEIVSAAPPSNSVDGTITVKLFHSYAFHADFTDVSDLKAVSTVSLPSGVREDLFDNVFLRYYELEENTDTADDFRIVEPNDFATSQRQWILKKLLQPAVSTQRTYFFIDKIQVEYLLQGKTSLEKVILEKTGEQKNKEILEVNVSHGSGNELVKTLPAVVENPRFANVKLNPVTINIPAFESVYSGYLRDSDGNMFTYWKRDAVDEERELQDITLSSTTTQYNRSLKRITSSFAGQEFFGLDVVLREVNDDNTIYLPMGFSLDDKNVMYSGEVIELVNVFEGGVSPFTSAFTIGFGDSGFN